MSSEIGAKRPSPRLLPMVRLWGVDYFIDERLGEFRAVWNPHHRVEFGSAKGLEMLHQIGIVTCRDCGQEFGVSLVPTTREEIICPACQTHVPLASMRPPRHGEIVG